MEEMLTWGHLKENGPTVEEQGEERTCPSTESFI